MMDTKRAWTRRAIVASALALGACTAEELQQSLDILAAGQSPASADSDAGVREALRVGTSAAVAQVGRQNGYLTDPKVRIPLPPKLEQARSTLTAIGLGPFVDEVEIKMNRAAEAAAPEATDIFFQAIRAMSLNDAIGIVRGPQNAATQYFERTMTPALTELFTPPMQSALASTGAISAFDALLGRLNQIPLAPQLGSNIKADLVSHAVGEGLDGLFYYVAREEAKVRANPAAYGSEILIRVFG